MTACLKLIYFQFWLVAMCKNTTVFVFSSWGSLAFVDFLCHVFPFLCKTQRSPPLFFKKKPLCLEWQLCISDLPGNVSQIQAEIVLISGSANRLTARILNALACRVSTDLDVSNCQQLLGDCQNHLFLPLMVNFRGKRHSGQEGRFFKGTNGSQASLCHLRLWKPCPAP